MFEELFKNKKPNNQKLISYGFKNENEMFIYSIDIMSEQFIFSVTIKSDGEFDTSVIEKDTNEEYILYKTKAEGAFVGEVRQACQKVLNDISEKCFETDIFKSEQTKAVIEYVRKKYNDELEFLWERFSDNAVWRRSDNSKWYGVILTVSKNKLGINSKEKAEIIDLRIQPEIIEEILSKPNYYPGWHMNKKHWYTIILDNSIPNEEIFKLIDISYKLALK